MEGKQKHHWTSWKYLCIPTKEEGICIRHLHEIADTFASKLWWIFRSNTSLWTDFLKAKYCRRIHPMERKFSYTQSHTWRRMMNIRGKIDHLIMWRIHASNSSFWWDNWSGKGQLSQYGNASTSINIKVASYMNGQTWNICKLEQCLPPDIVHHIQRVKINSSDPMDQPI